MTNAAIVLKNILTKEFGFKHILFVYSGRRGIHIWVCDRRARSLTDQQRSNIVSYVTFTPSTTMLHYSLWSPCFID